MIGSQINEDLILKKSKLYSHNVYKLSRRFPVEERYGLTSQLRRAAVSVPLNLIEGYSRQSSKSEVQFLKVAYGSIKESQYIVKFAVDEGYVSEQSVLATLQLGEEVAKMIWAKTQTLRSKNKKQ